MTPRNWLSVLSLVCLIAAGCDKHPPKKPDPTKATVTGIVLCSDTGKPARFATVTLTAAPKKSDKADESNPLPASESTVTDLDGRFRLEAVEPGHYYAFAILEGYLDPMRGLDPDRILAKSMGWEQRLDSIDQWRDHLFEVTAIAHRTAEVVLQIERAAEIDGTVSFDDGSPAIGMQFQLFRKTEKAHWAEVGLKLMSDWAIPALSNGHGHYSLTNLPAGEYQVCTLMPVSSPEASPRVCLGNTFRRRDATTVKVQAGETASGIEIVIPLMGLNTVSGIVSALADGHPVDHATVTLLYADDREKAREVKLTEGGEFQLSYVPEGSYILKVSGAEDAKESNPEPPQPGEARPDPAAKKANAPRHYVDKEIPLIVQDDMEEVNLTLATSTPNKPQ